MEITRSNVILVAVIIGLSIALKECGKSVEHLGPVKFTPLKADEQLRVSVKRSEIKIARRDNPDIVTKARHVDISVKDDGRVVVTEKKWGFTFEPGLGLIVVNQAGLSVSTQVLYAKAFGLDLGLGYLPRERFSRAFKPYIAVSYDLPFRLTPNTSVYAGMTLSKEPVVGLKVRF